MAAKNRMGKARKPGNAYISFTDARSGWNYEILKSYQLDGSKPYARVFARVQGFGDDFGDTYVADLPRGWALQELNYDPEVFTSGADALQALFGSGVPSAPSPF